MWRDEGPKTQGGSLALRHYHQAICHLCILGMVAWLSDGQCQEKTKQDPKISMLRDNRSYVHHPTNAVEALICLTPLGLVIQNEPRSAAHRLWSLGCWSYLHPKRGHSSILMWLQQSDSIFNMGVNIMRPEFNPEPQYRVIMLTREDWTKATGTSPAVKGLVWFTDGSRTGVGDRGWSLRAIGRTKAQFFPR